MRTGIVIVLTNRQKEINILGIERFLKENVDIDICFVNNGSKDKTSNILETLNKKFPSNSSVVNIKKNKGEDAALKVGFRYLLNKKNISKLNFSTKFNLNQIMRFSEFSTNFLVDI
ncbi:MAG: glycosyltransferase [Lutibacter sp.]|uniref:glycosyltransferase n=1 Tax=Lutibacter sp. TaxID=1925666 RepID=UPI0017A139EC|nr:glycosyltransferase [Lutibacter sp.]MBT8316491.1 glycosyltransferase [Lutibacter sp.]NNJ57351.1 glycosyltransferase [Lutibacter sp.]